MKQTKLSKWVGRRKPGMQPIEVHLRGDIANSPAHAAAMDGARLWLDLHFAQEIDANDPTAVHRLILSERESLRKRIRDEVEVAVMDLPEFQEYRRVGREHDAAKREQDRLKAKLEELKHRRKAEELSDAPGIARRLQAVDREAAAAQVALDEATAEVNTLQPLLAPRRKAVEVKLEPIKNNISMAEREDLERKEQCLLERLFGESGELLDELAATRLALRDVLASGPALTIDLDKIERPSDDDDPEEGAPLFPADAASAPAAQTVPVSTTDRVTELVQPVVGQPIQEPVVTSDPAQLRQRLQAAMERRERCRGEAGAATEPEPAPAG